MKIRLITFVLLTLFILPLPPMDAGAASADIRWHPFEKGLALGKKENKKVFVYFWATWCNVCEKMEKETLKDTSVIAYLNKHFVAVKIDFDKNRALADSFGITGVPDNWFFDESKQVITNRPGFIPARMFLPMLKYLQTDSYKKMTFAKFLLSM